MSATEWFVLAVVCLLAFAAAAVVLLLAWPLILCWYLGHPVVGVLAEVIWLASLR